MSALSFKSENKFIYRCDLFPTSITGSYKNTMHFVRADAVECFSMLQNKGCNPVIISTDNFNIEPIEKNTIVYYKNILGKSSNKYTNDINISLISLEMIQREVVFKTDKLYYKNESDRQYIKDKLITMLTIAYNHGYDSIIMSDFNFNLNPPNEIANIVLGILQNEFSNAFKHVTLSITNNDHLEIFKNTVLSKARTNKKQSCIIL